MERNFDDHVDSYAALSADERKRLLEYVQMHPEREPDLEDAHVEAFFAGLPDEPVTDAVLARYASMRLFNTGHGVPGHIQEAYRRIEQSLASDPEARARFERLSDRINRIDASTNAVAQFERLTGHRLTTTPEATRQGTRDRDPHARRAPGGSRIGRWAATGAVLVLICYATAFFAYRLHPPLETTAYRAAQQRLENWNVRGVPSAVNTDEERLRAAIETVRSSFYYRLGVIPSYRRQPLENGSEALRDIASDSDVPPVQQEARYFLGLAELALGETDAARTDLQAVLRDQGFRSTEAEAMLEKMKEIQ